MYLANLDPVTFASFPYGEVSNTLLFYAAELPSAQQESVAEHILGLGQPLERLSELGTDALHELARILSHTQIVDGIVRLSPWLEADVDAVENGGSSSRQ